MCDDIPVPGRYSLIVHWSGVKFFKISIFFNLLIISPIIMEIQ